MNPHNKPPQTRNIHPVVQKTAGVLVPIKVEHIGQTHYGVSPTEAVAGAIHDTLHPGQAAERRFAAADAARTDKLVGNYLSQLSAERTPTQPSKAGIIANAKARAAQRMAVRVIKNNSQIK